MVRFVTIIIGVINFLILRAWVGTNAYLFNLFEKLIPFKAVTFIGLGVVICLFIFLIIHSLRLVFFHESAIRVQKIICIIDPFIRLIGVILIINFETKFKLSLGVAVTMISIFTIIDIMIFMYLRRQSTIEVFKAAEDRREQKFRMKLMTK